MGVCWMLMILLSCMLPHASLHQSPKDTLRVCSLPQNPDLEIRCQNAQSHQPVFIPCPNVSIEVGKFQLFKNQTILCQLGTNNLMVCNQTKIKVQPCKSESNQIVGFNLFGPEIARDQAIYRCNAIIHFPPPYVLKQSNERIIIFTEDHCSCNKDKGPVEESQGLLWVWIAAVSLLSTYGLAITIVASINWLKMKEAENQNDYMNTKPKAPRNRKKKGLQTPIPRHF
ncbi:uncharacterized protein LOC106510835 [Austrofundulus limnaeus]|uniref:Uncharacterized protein LOC106510835 n=1 Tax=Austrofundulus limnaeus TaxID=52670 RepID=A0A2I4AHM4_AUSLI|nr:PREDICTED: uncharacterized protein LOC106510835 [Austrofundulus limnaeus]